MAEKTLLQIFAKYEPSEQYAAWLSIARNIRMSADKVQRMIQVHADFPMLIPKRELYAVEREIEKVYQLRMARLLPHYPAELFTQEYISELVTETERIGIVARGFFHSYRARLEDNELVIEMPYIDEGILLMEAGKTPEVMEGIIRSEFGKGIKVRLCHSQELAAAYSYRGVEEELAQWDARLKQSSAEYDRMQESRRSAGPSEASAPSAPLASSDPDAVRKMSLLGDLADAEIENGVCRIGNRSYDISEPQFAIGGSFDIRPVPIGWVNKPMRNVVIVGEVFGYTAEANRAGDKINVNFALTDGNTSIMVKKFSLAPEDAKELGDCVSFLGSMPPERVREFMERANIFTFTSNSMEGWGAVVNEAMSSGCAVVASSAPGSVMTMIRDGECGLVYSENNYDEFSTKLRDLVTNPALAEKIGRNAYKTIADSYNADVAAKRFIEYCEKMLRGEPLVNYTEGIMQKI